MCQIGGWNCFWCRKAILGGIGQGGQNVRTAPCPTVRTGPDRAGHRPDRGRTGSGQGPVQTLSDPCRACPDPVRSYLHFLVGSLKLGA